MHRRARNRPRAGLPAHSHTFPAKEGIPPVYLGWTGRSPAGSMLKSHVALSQRHQQRFRDRPRAGPLLWQVPSCSAPSRFPVTGSLGQQEGLKAHITLSPVAWPPNLAAPRSLGPEHPFLPACFCSTVTCRRHLLPKAPPRPCSVSPLFRQVAGLLTHRVQCLPSPSTPRRRRCMTKA